MKKEKIVTEQQLIDAIANYTVWLSEQKTISATRFHAMQSALYGAKCIIHDLFGTKRKSEHAIIK